jgi:hypothetical protein
VNRKHVFTPEQDARVCEAYLNRTPLLHLAHEWYIPRHAIINRASRLGLRKATRQEVVSLTAFYVAMRGEEPLRRRFNLADALMKRSKGETYEEVARWFGAAPSAIRRAISSTRDPDRRAISSTRDPDRRAFLSEIDASLLIQTDLF